MDIPDDIRKIHSNEVPLTGGFIFIFKYHSYFFANKYLNLIENSILNFNIINFHFCNFYFWYF